MKTLTLPRTQFGNPILRKKAQKVALNELRKHTFKKLIQSMFATIQDIGVGLAAPQIGKSIQLAVVDIHPLPHRPNIESFRRVIFNSYIFYYS